MVGFGLTGRHVEVFAAVENGTIYDQNLILTSYVALPQFLTYYISLSRCTFQRPEPEQDRVRNIRSTMAKRVYRRSLSIAQHTA